MACRMTFDQFHSRTILFSCGALALCSQALGQTGDSRQLAAQPVLENIVVTAQRIEQTANEVGMDIRVFTGEQLDQLRITSVSDLTALVPSFTLSQSYQGVPTYTLRGIGPGCWTPRPLGAGPAALDGPSPCCGSTRSEGLAALALVPGVHVTSASSEMAGRLGSAGLSADGSDDPMVGDSTRAVPFFTARWYRFSSSLYHCFTCPHLYASFVVMLKLVR